MFPPGFAGAWPDLDVTGPDFGVAGFGVVGFRAARMLADDSVVGYKSLTVVLGLERAVDWHAEIIGLCFAELGQFDPDFFQMQARDFFVELLGKHMDADLERVGLGPQRELREDLI